VYAANSAAGTVSVIDAANGNAVSTVTVGNNPAALAVLGSKVYVANRVSGTVSVIDTANGNATSTVTVGGGPAALAVLGDKVYAANSGAGTVSVIDTANGNSVTTVTVGDSPAALAILGDKVYVANNGAGTVSVIDTANGNAVSSVSLPADPAALAVLGDKVYAANYSASTVSVIDTANGNAVSTVTVGAAPFTLATLGTKVYAASQDDDVVSVVETDGTAPSVSFVAPVNLAAVAGAAVPLSASASDNASVSGVQFKVGSASIGAEDTSSPYGATWDSTAVADGAYTLSAVARDPAGNRATSTVTVTVDNTAPSAPTLSEPTNGSDVTSWSPSVEWGDAADCAYRIGEGSFASLDCARAGADIAEPGLGSHTLVVRGRDEVGNASYATSTFTLEKKRSSSSGRGGGGGGSSGGSPDGGASAGTSAAPAAAEVSEAAAILLGETSSAAYPAAGPQGAAGGLGVAGVRDLSEGSSQGSDVRALQVFLNASGFALAASGPGAPGAETEFFGPRTRAALARWQAANGVFPAVGYYGPRTRAAIAAAL
jgi:YVTN family beta-propeller protein